MTASTRWSDDTFLDSLRLHGDARADACVAELNTSSDFAALFKQMTYNNAPLPPETPRPIAEFCAATAACPRLETDLAAHPDGVDRARLERGEVVFLNRSTQFCLILLAKSLPEGYSAPCLGEILSLSGELHHHPYRRIVGVVQLVVNVCAKGGFEPDGKALVTAQQARLLHAGIRRIVPPRLPHYEAKYGKPVNLEDMLATIMGFSLLLIEGMPKLGHTVTEPHAEDLYYVWRVFAVAMGIHPPYEENNGEWVPANLTEAREFYQSYQRRHYEPDPSKNPHGVALARDNHQMLIDLLPKGLRFPPFTNLSGGFMTQLIGHEGCERLGIKPIPSVPPFSWLAYGSLGLLMWVGRVWDRLDPNGTLHYRLDELVLQKMVNKEYGGAVTFKIPRNLQQVRELVEQPVQARRDDDVTGGPRMPRPGAPQ